MLIKNFDGRSFMVKSQDGMKIDCMFFPHNDEQVKLVSEMKTEEPKYIYSPTVIFFNPNAQFYQQ